MNILLKIFTIIVSTILFCKVIYKYILKNNYNILHFIYILFYVVQTLPIVQVFIFGIDDDIMRYGITYEALLDKQTDVVYSMFVIITSILIYVFANKINKIKKKIDILEIKEKIKKTFIFRNKNFKIIIFFGMFITIPFVFFAPNIKVYTNFAYFYRNDNYSFLTNEYMYHHTVIKRLNTIALVCSALFYMINNKKENNIFIIISAILFTWINQKRTMILFFFLGILFIDLFIRNIEKKKFIKKAIIFLLIEIIYFIVYRNITGKGTNHTFSWLYTFYFSRMANVKVSIYDMFISRNMLSFTGQSFLADIFWFVPRVIWSSKPYPYDNYYTAFVYGKNLFEISWDFQVNMWCEFFSNFALLGPFMGIFFIYYIAKKVETTSNIFVYLFGSFFIILYSVFGCTGIVSYCLTFFILFNIISKFKFTNNIK